MSSVINEKLSMEESRERLLKNRLVWVCATVGFTSFMVFIGIWFTNVFRDAILSNLELRNGTATFSLWQRPQVRALYKIYVFNFTNAEDFVAGRDKRLRVQQVGPYVYRETLTRVNVKLHDNGTVSYQEQRSFKWEGGSPDDQLVTVPNVPLFSAVAFSKNIHYVQQLIMTAALSTLQSKPFVQMKVGELLWGYDDEIFRIAKPFLAFQQSQPVTIDKFGLLAMKNGVSNNRITIHTGVGNINKIGVLSHLNGMEKRDIWGDEICDKVDGTDGTMFPPNVFLNRNSTLTVYSQDMCRTLPLKFDSYSEAYGIPVLRYKPPSDVFTSSLTKDFCYCSKNSESVYTSRSCPPAGIFNISACSFGLPTLTSFPHFYLADKSVYREIEGLNPRAELHETYVDLHPRLGIPISGWSRFQINVEARTAKNVPFLQPLKDGAILPMIWMEIGIDRMPDGILSVLNHAYFTAKIVETSLQWGSLFSIVLSTLMFLIIVRKSQNKSLLPIKRIISGKTKLIE